MHRLSVVLALASCAPTAMNEEGPAPGDDGEIAFGVLAANPQYADEDYAVGIRWATIELDWAAIEPSRGQFVASELQREQVLAYRAAGWKVELSFGLHGNWPAWALNVEPWKDQTGATNLEGPNWFNATVQKDVADYIGFVVTTIGAANIDNIRIGGTSGAGEVNYPVLEAPYRYSAYSASALAGTTLVPKNPAPQCKPPSCTAQDAAVFIAWYVDALTTFCNFQVATVRAAGYMRDVSWLFAGGGITPGLKALMLAHGLAPTDDQPDDYGVASGGIDEPRIIEKIFDKDERTVIVNSGINDSTVDEADEASSDPERWSAPHWTAYNADRFHLRKAAENVGYGPGGYDSAARMQLAVSTASAFGYTRLMWAFDTQLRTENGAKLADYARLIEQNR